MVQEVDPEHQSLKADSSSAAQVHYVSIPINKDRRFGAGVGAGSSNDYPDYLDGSSEMPTQYQGIRRRTSILDPKTVLCALFKIGNCNKGARCKFSHDMNVGRRVEKRDLYQDTRSEKEEDTMDNWDEAKLRSVILSKHGNPRTTTEKVCKYFIEAVENGKYGWFWICPNGGDKCMYKHSLPEGFVLKTKEQKRLEMEAFEKKPKITLEEFIETERERLDKRNLTPITMDNFAEWKKNHRIERLNLEKENNLKKKPSGREVVLKKYTEDKRFDLVDETDSTNGSAWDLTEFTKALRDEDSNGSSGIKDYGDGSNPTFELPSRDGPSKQSTTLTA